MISIIDFKTLCKIKVYLPIFLPFCVNEKLHYRQEQWDKYRRTHFSSTGSRGWQISDFKGSLDYIVGVQANQLHKETRMEEEEEEEEENRGVGKSSSLNLAASLLVEPWKVVWLCWTDFNYIGKKLWHWPFLVSSSCKNVSFSIAGNQVW